MLAHVHVAGVMRPLETLFRQTKLHSLDHLWKIACDYRADHKGPGDANKHTLKTPAQARNHVPRPEVFKRVE
jgi:hypothetical protein